jgi:chromosome segregation ATPase
MSKLHDRFANFLSEIEQMEKDNEKLTEDIQQLEKEKTDGYSKFNTETHALIEREDLKYLVSQIEEAESDISSAENASEYMYSQSEEVNNNCEYARRAVEKASKTIYDMLGDKGDE